MKALKFYIRGAGNTLVRYCVEYLIDAGHFVYFDSTSMSHDDFHWSESLSHGFTNISDPEFNYDLIDYVIDFTNNTISHSKPRIDIDIKIEGDVANISAILISSERILELTDARTRLKLIQKTYPEIAFEINECIIDAIILLSRNNPESNDVNINESDDKGLYYIASIEMKLSKLSKFHNTINKEDVFRLEDSLYGTPSSNDYAHINYNISANFTNINQTDFELLGLFVLSMLNSRKSGKYEYLLYRKGTCFTKFIDLNISDNYSEINSEINDAIYDVFDDFFRLDLKTKNDIMCLDFDNTVTEEHFPIVVKYIAEKNTIQISYSKSYIYFNYFVDYLDLYFEYLEAFKLGDFEYSKMLTLPGKHLDIINNNWNNTAKDLPESKTILDLFRGHVNQSPDSIAIISGNSTITYSQLDQYSNQISNYIISEMSHSGHAYIGVLLERNYHLVATLIAIMKAGFTYIPLDNKYPKDRIDYVIENSGMSLLMTNKCYLHKIERNICAENKHNLNEYQVCCLDDADIQSKIMNHDTKDLRNTNISNTDLAYVIFTSGTTGKPKGVAIKHISLLNLICSFADILSFSKYEAFLSVTTIAFDISALEIFLPLSYGAKLILASESDVLHPKTIIHLLDQHKITMMQATPALWSLILPEAKDRKLSIKALCGGEALPISLAKKLVATVKECWNVYGPTETTIWSTAIKLNDEMQTISIGRPIANTYCHILDNELNEQPIGVVGELCIGGVGVAAYYLNRDDLTKDRFINYRTDDTSSPINPLKHRLYKTGDLARWNTDGHLEYIGRNDFQVKIRGFRIELAEIEQVMLEYTGINQAVVVVKNLKIGNQDKQDTIVAYYISDDEINTKSLEKFLTDHIPDYMLPNAFIRLERMPLNVNGKLDRSQLPEPKKISHNDFMSPISEVEKKLAPIWSETLGIDLDSIDVRDDFFTFGGNSITAIRLINRINSELRCDIKISDVFLEKTYEKIALVATKSLGHFEYQEFLIEKHDDHDEFEPFAMNNVQQSYYLGRNQNFDLSNVSTHVYSEHSFSELDVNKLESTLNTLLQRHYSFRTIFENNQQRYLRSIPYYSINLYEHNSLESLLEIRESLSHKLYDPGTYPLFDIIVSKYNNKYIIHLSFDAIIIDMGSFEIFFKEWIGLYNDNNFILKPLAISYRDYVLNYEKIRKSAIFQKALDYWLNKIESYNFNMSLPLQSLPADVKSPKFKRITKTISRCTWDKIVEKARHHNLSPTSIILEVYGKIISYWSGQPQVCINLTLFNRLPLHQEVDNIIGDFTVLELFNYYSKNELSISDKILNTHKSLLNDIENNIFDGVDFQRLIKAKKLLPPNQIVAPIVLTSVIGNEDNESLFNFPLNDTYIGTEYSISQTSQVWLDHKAYVTQDGFVAEWDYVDQLFSPELISEMHTSYCDLLERIALSDWSTERMPHITLSQKNIDVINNANQATQIIPSLNIVDHYETYIRSNRLEDNIAIIDDSNSILYTYKQFLEESLFLARYISNMHSTTSLIAVLTEKGYTQALCVASIMKSANAYLPLNVEWPIERLLEVLKQGKVKDIFVSKTQFNNTKLKKLLSGEFNLIVIDDILLNYRNDDKFSTSLNTVNCPVVSPESTAYVIFTSGSTGKPKGVSISHRSAMNTLVAMIDRFNMNEHDRILSLSELSFDLSVFDIFSPLMVGARIVFPDQNRVKDTAYWHYLVDSYKITFWNSVPQLARLFIDELNHRPCQILKPSIRVFLLSGDWIPVDLPNRIKQSHPNSIVMSLGGATEGSIWSIWYEIHATKSNWSKIPYGMAMPNQKMYVLNAELEHCPVGVVGEIYIGGLGVAQNYFGDVALTKIQFIPHPNLGRLYKTGDLGVWHKEGYMEFIGRNDNQVKLNGYRVELEEISAKIKRLCGVKEVITTINKDGKTNLLVSYIQPVDINIHTTPESATFKADLVSKQYAIINNDSFKYQLSPKINLDDYKLRKSYRSFLSKIPDLVFVKNTCEKTQKNIISKKPGAKNLTNLPDLEWILSVISGLDNGKGSLPKYRYPSASSTYPIRCFYYTTGLNDQVEPGYYYYNPAEYTLAEHSLIPLVQRDDLTNNEIHLVIHWPAILPIYQEQSERLAWLEIGHILSLMISIFDQLDLGYELDICNQTLDIHNKLALRIRFGASLSTRLTTSPRVQLYLKEYESDSYVGNTTNRKIDLSHCTLLNRLSNNGCLLEKGKMLITLEDKASIETYISSGMILQELSEVLADHDIGSCLLGSVPTEGVICAMVLGTIDSSEKEKLVTTNDKISLDEFLTNQLAQVLPSYMIPQSSMFIDELPLSANGKVDISRLPKPSISIKTHLPQTNIQKDLASIWGMILDLDIHSICVDENFFDLGGNSLSAMQLTMQLRNQFNLDVKLNDIYSQNTINKIIRRYNLESNKITARGSL